MKIKAADLDPRTYPAVAQNLTELTNKYRKFIMYIKSTLGALAKGPVETRMPEESQKELAGYLNTLQQAFDNVNKVLSQKHPTKWNLAFPSLGQLKSLMNQTMSVYDRVLPDSPIKPVYRDTVNIAVDEFLPVVESLTNSVIDSVADAKSKFPKEETKPEPKKEEVKEEKKEEPKEEKLDKALEDSRKELEKEDKELSQAEEEEAKSQTDKQLDDMAKELKKEEDEEEEAPKEKSENWKPFEEMSPKELRQIGNDVKSSISKTFKHINHFIDVGLKELPSMESFTEGNKIKDFKKELSKFESDVRSLYKKSPEERSKLADKANDLVTEFKDSISNISKEISNVEKRPKIAAEYVKDLIKAKSVLEDVYELLTFGRTFKRASSMLKKLAEGEDPKEHINSVIDLIKKSEGSQYLRYHILNMLSTLENVFEDEESPELTEVGEHIKEAEQTYKDGLIKETVEHLQQAIQNL